MSDLIDLGTRRPASNQFGDQAARIRLSLLHINNLMGQLRDMAQLIGTLPDQKEIARCIESR